MNITFPVYKGRHPSGHEWITVGLGEHTVSKTGSNAQRLREKLLDDVRRAAEKATPRELGRFVYKAGTRLRHVKLDLSLRGDGKKRAVTGLCPVILEPRTTSTDDEIVIAYHPKRPREWFPLNHEADLAQAARSFFQTRWESLSDDELERLWATGREVLMPVSLSVTTTSLLSRKRKRDDVWSDLNADPQGRVRETAQVLRSLGTDLTSRVEADRSAGKRAVIPREPFRSQIARLLCGKSKKSFALVGPHGSGRTSLLKTAIADLLADDEFDTHRNLDRVHHVFRIEGKHLIAGMSLVGAWEERCMDLLANVRASRAILYVPDVHLFGRIGKARDSTRSLADYFVGPLRRGELVIIAECTDAQYMRLQEDHPAFASAFSALHVLPTTPDETYPLLFALGRELASDKSFDFEPSAYKAVVELSTALYPQQAMPGLGAEVLRAIAASMHQEDDSSIGGSEVEAFLADRAGLPGSLFCSDETFDPEALRTRFETRVVGQKIATNAMVELGCRIRSGLCDPKRPLGVFLFTGPTGTGKTELAKTLADEIFGSESRLIRLDMSEYGTPAAVSRIVGDAYSPEGHLTKSVGDQPFSVVLFDEIEKADPAVLNLLLQLLEEGRLTDAAGTTASFLQCVIVMTSNLGGRRENTAGFGERHGADAADVNRAIREFFSPELFNRIDRIVPFSPLDDDAVARVAKKELGKFLLRRGFIDRNIFVEAGDAVIRAMVDRAYQAEGGARSIKRYLDDEIGAVLSFEISKAPQAFLRVVRLLPRAEGSFSVDHEALTEALPVGDTFTIESMLSLANDALRKALIPLCEAIDELLASEDGAAVAKNVTLALEARRRSSTFDPGRIFDMDWGRDRLKQLQREASDLMVSSRDLELEKLEVVRFGREERTPGRGFGAMTTRVFARHEMGEPVRASRKRLLEMHAQFALLKRGLARGAADSLATVDVELAQVGSEATFLLWLAYAYATEWGTLVSASAIVSGEVLRIASLDDLKRLTQCSFVVLRLSGFALLDLGELETGTHVWRSLTRAPELVRVSVTHARLESTCESIAAARRTSDQKDGAETVDNAGEIRPRRLLPIVRQLQFEPRPRSPSECTIEDYRMAFAATFQVKALAPALATLWLVARSRTSASTSLLATEPAK